MSVQHGTRQDVRRSERAGLPSLIVFVGLSFLVAAVGALASTDAATVYASLDRPAWAPPSWLFGPVWTVLYALIGVSAWLVWRAEGHGARAELGFWGVQLLLNAAWTPLFSLVSAVVADTGEPTPPCGPCRQILWEFGGDLEVILANTTNNTGRWRLSALLPVPFDGRFLGSGR